MLKFTRIRTVSMIGAGVVASLVCGQALARQAATDPMRAKPVPGDPPIQATNPASTPAIAPAIAPSTPGASPGAVPQGVPQVVPTQAPATLPDALEIEFPSFNWGDIGDTAPVSKKVKFKNKTDRTLTIAASATCGCTVAGLEKNVYAAGESGEIEAKFNPAGRRGPQQKEVIVTVTDPQGVYAQQRIAFTSNVKPLVWMEPQKLYEPEVNHKEGKATSFTVYGRKEGFAVSKAESNSEFTKITVGTPSVVDQNGEKVTQVPIEIVLGKGAPLGNFQTQVTVSTNDEKAPTQNIFVGGDVVGDLKATPSQAIVRTNTTSTPFKTEVRLDTRAGKPFKITGVEVEGRSDMKLVPDITPGEGGKYFMLTLSGVTPAEPSFVQGAVIVTADTNDGETIRIPFTAQISRVPTPPAPGQ